MELENFFNLVKQDTDLQERLRKASDQEAGIKLALQLGAEKGYSFTETDVRNFWAGAQAQKKQAVKLSEEELESVAAAGTVLGSVCVCVI
ncbi:MAG: Nif11-like leader peptide family RiPP precursor [Spirulina sp.]